jgi:hypothetical protein
MARFRAVASRIRFRKRNDFGVASVRNKFSFATSDYLRQDAWPINYAAALIEAMRSRTENVQAEIR